MALKARDKTEAYQSITDSIEKSTVLYIFIDGESLCKDTYDERVKSVKKGVRTINAYVQEFSESHQSTSPPIVFVITKADLCTQYLGDDIDKEIPLIIKECFDFLLCAGMRVYVTMVSLGKNISDDDYSGDVEPVNMHIPFFIGIYHQFLNFCFALKYEIDKEENRSRDKINDYNAEIRQEQNKGGVRRFFDKITGGTIDIDYRRRQIANANDTIKSNRELFTHYKKLMLAVSTQLLRDSVYFKMYEDGVEKDFDASESFEL